MFGNISRLATHSLTHCLFWCTDEMSFMPLLYVLRDKTSSGHKVLTLNHKEIQKKTFYTGQNVLKTKGPTDKTSYGQNIIYNNIRAAYCTNILRKEENEIF